MLIHRYQTLVPAEGERVTSLSNISYQYQVLPRHQTNFIISTRRTQPLFQVQALGGENAVDHFIPTSLISTRSHNQVPPALQTNRELTDHHSIILAFTIVPTVIRQLTAAKITQLLSVIPARRRCFNQIPATDAEERTMADFASAGTFVILMARHGEMAHFMHISTSKEYTEYQVPSNSILCPEQNHDHGPCVGQLRREIEAARGR
ncbi:hypothetical protein EJ08DRAFT_129688 [Tothia fuscella]|uniref:Uncharacterized protein n=1 Tax=Tothia fuscella TaxID=1048955 RepID=A0A9P4NW68_9PEZI|nr:hypothetical protein EJ08DRAFT_129688 [Tothia fuscella]